MNSSEQDCIILVQSDFFRVIQGLINGKNSIMKSASYLPAKTIMFYYDFMTGEIFLYYESKFLCIGSNILLYTISLITNFDSVMEAFVV